MRMMTLTKITDLAGVKDMEELKKCFVVMGELHTDPVDTLELMEGEDGVI